MRAQLETLDTQRDRRINAMAGELADAPLVTIQTRLHASHARRSFRQFAAAIARGFIRRPPRPLSPAQLADALLSRLPRRTIGALAAPAIGVARYLVPERFPAEQLLPDRLLGRRVVYMSPSEVAGGTGSTVPTVNAGDSYTCAACGGTFEATRDHDEQLAEYSKAFPDSPPEDRDVVCDDCYRAMMPPSGVVVKTCGDPSELAPETVEALGEMGRAVLRSSSNDASSDPPQPSPITIESNDAPASDNVDYGKPAAPFVRLGDADGSIAPVYPPGEVLGESGIPRTSPTEPYRPGRLIGRTKPGERVEITLDIDAMRPDSPYVRSLLDIARDDRPRTADEAALELPLLQRGIETLAAELERRQKQADRHRSEIRRLRRSRELRNEALRQAWTELRERHGALVDVTDAEIRALARWVDTPHARLVYRGFQRSIGEVVISLVQAHDAAVRELLERSTAAAEPELEPVDEPRSPELERALEGTATIGDKGIAHWTPAELDAAIALVHIYRAQERTDHTIEDLRRHAKTLAEDLDKALHEIVRLRGLDA